MTTRPSPTFVRDTEWRHNLTTPNHGAHQVTREVACDKKGPVMTITHEDAAELAMTYPEWAMGVHAAERDLDHIRALTRDEAMAVADRHFEANTPSAAAYWSGYVAAIVRYERPSRRASGPYGDVEVR